MPLPKELLRQQMAAEKSRWSAAQRNELSLDVLSKLEHHEMFRHAHTVLLYYSLPDEVNTHHFVQRWASDKQILLPVVAGWNLEIRPYNGNDCLQVGAFGILEPATPPISDYSVIDLVVVPGVAFDRQGHRLGRGKGYYDRLLPLINAYKIGLCFPFQLIDDIPVDEFDVRMDAVIW